jgi:uncharacterized protein
MEIRLSIPGGTKVVERYGNGGFFISGERHEGSVLLYRDMLLPWPVGAITEADFAQLAGFIGRDPPVEVLLIGCGPSMTLLPATLKNGFRAHGIVVEPMDTGAACRTFNVMLSEDRRVAAALIAI